MSFAQRRKWPALLSSKSHKSYSFKYYLQLLHTMRCKKWKKKIGAWNIEVRNVEKNLTPDANFVLKWLSIFKRYCWLFQDPYWKKDVAWMKKKHSNFKDENILEILKEWSEFWRFLKSILRGREWVGRGWRSWVVEGGGQGLKFAEKDRCFSRFKPVTLRKVLSRNYAITSIGWT